MPQIVYERSKSLQQRPTAFCPGCLHATAARLIAECLDELDVQNNTVAVMPIGCACLQVYNFDTQLIMSPHGRAPAVATGVKRTTPDSLVFSYQGDGDLAAIGLAEIMHCANRGENITSIFINNGIYGMTGGQMAPTTLSGQPATTTPPGGRDVGDTGHPMKMCEIISQLKAPAYVARFALDTPANIIKAKKGLKYAFELQLAKKGYGFIELMCNCPTNWRMTPLDSLKYMKEHTIPFFPLGEYVKKEGDE